MTSVPRALCRRRLAPFLGAHLLLLLGAVGQGRAQEPAPAAVPAAVPAVDPEAAARRAQAEKLAALPDAEFTAWVQTHREALTAPLVAAVLRAGRELGVHGDNAGHERAVRYAGEMANLSGDALSAMRVKWHAAGMEAELHHVDQGLRMINEAIALAPEAKAPPGDLAGMLGARIVMYGIKGQYAPAMGDCDRAIALAAESHNGDAAMAALTTLINIYQRQGQPERSLPYLEQAARWAEGNDHMLIYVDGNYATTYHQMGNLAKAQECLGRALATARRINDANMIGQMLSSAGDYAREVQDFAGGRRYLDEALALNSKIGNDLARVDTLIHLAELDEAQGRHEAAIAGARTALAGAQETGEFEAASQAQDILGQALASAGQTAEAAAAFRASIDLIEQIRAGSAGDEESAQATLQKHIDPYQRLTSLLVADGKTEEAFSLAESAKARVLRDILKGGRMDLAGSLTEDERARQEASEQQLAGLNRALQAARHAGDAAATEKAGKALDAGRLEARNLDAELLSAHPEVRRREALSVPPAIAPMLAAACASGAVFLEYVSAPDRTTLFMAGPGKQPLEARVLPIGAGELREKTERFREGLAGRALNWKSRGEALAQLLLGPAGERLGKAGRVVIVPDGPLWDLPFQALPRSGGGCLVDRLAVSCAPSAAFLERVRQERPSRDLNGKARLLAAGNPAAGAGPPNPATPTGDALPEAEDEVRELGKMYGAAPGDILIGDQAREDVFKKKAPDYDIIHLATHGLLNDANPLYSCLLMAQTDLAPDEDGLLEAHEIMGLHLRARLAVLAACETARGRDGAGEGQLGFSWALMVAGCPASVVSQWKVDSRSNKTLMLELHRQLRAGQPADEALRQASLALRKTPGYENPFYWAPFTVVGDGS